MYELEGEYFWNEIPIKYALNKRFLLGDPLVSGAAFKTYSHIFDNYIAGILLNLLLLSRGNLIMEKRWCLLQKWKTSGT